MSYQLTAFLNNYSQKVEDALLRLLPRSDKPGTDMLNEAIHRALFPSGKRMRPLFTLLATRTVGGDPVEAIPIACAIEYFHTCSLIFDDLPAMDNAHERRGRKPIHRIFGEDVALLAALAFLNQGFAITAQVRFSEKQENRSEMLLHEVTRCIGPDGMIGGQLLDLRLKKKQNEELRSFSYLKTTALMRLMLSAGAMVGGASIRQIESLAVIGEHLGEAYQMLDDIVDEFEDCSCRQAGSAKIDVNALWKKADLNLKIAQRKLQEDLADNDTILLTALVDKIFLKIKKKAADHLLHEKGPFKTASNGSTFIRLRRGRN